MPWKDVQISQKEFTNEPDEPVVSGICRMLLPRCDSLGVVVTKAQATNELSVPDNPIMAEDASPGEETVLEQQVEPVLTGVGASKARRPPKPDVKIPRITRQCPPPPGNFRHWENHSRS